VGVNPQVKLSYSPPLPYQLLT